MDSSHSRVVVQHLHGEGWSAGGQQAMVGGRQRSYRMPLLGFRATSSGVFLTWPEAARQLQAPAALLPSPRRWALLRCHDCTRG